MPTATAVTMATVEVTLEVTVVTKGVTDRSREVMKAALLAVLVDIGKVLIYLFSYLAI